MYAQPAHTLRPQVGPSEVAGEPRGSCTTMGKRMKRKLLLLLRRSQGVTVCGLRVPPTLTEQGLTTYAK